MQNLVVLDLETKKLFHEVKDRRNDLLEVSVLGLYMGKDDSFRAYEEAELGEVWPILEDAALIVGYNIKKFDYEVLKPYYKGKLDRLPTLDLLEAIHAELGFRLRLDDLAQATLGIGKTGTGLKAVELYKAGKIDEVKKYCLNDVKITRDIYYYALKNGHLKYFDIGNQPKEFKVSWLDKLIEKNDLQMTLGV